MMFCVSNHGRYILELRFLLCKDRYPLFTGHRSLQKAIISSHFSFIEILVNGFSFERVKKPATTLLIPIIATNHRHMVNEDEGDFHD